MLTLLAHGGMLCPDEALAALTAVGASGGLIFMVKLRWHRIRVWVGFRLIARHLRRCHGECNFVFSYAPGKGILAPR
jgi:hypothetical protein